MGKIMGKEEKALSAVWSLESWIRFIGSGEPCFKGCAPFWMLNFKKDGRKSLEKGKDKEEV